MKETDMNAEKQTAVIILHYGDTECTLKCISSILKGSCQPDIILIDNDSSNRFFPLLRGFCSEVCLIDNKFYKNIRTFDFTFKFSKYKPFSVHGSFCILHYFKMAVNTGFSKGVNKGIKTALNFGKKMVLLLNNDVEVSFNAVEMLITEAFNSCGIKGALEMGMDKAGERGSNLIFAGGEIVWKEVPVQIKRIPDSWENSYGTSFIRGSCMAIPAEVIKNVGFFDEKFFAYMEDVDYCIRAANMGYDLKIVPGAVVWHSVSLSVNSYTKNFLMAENYVKLLFKHVKDGKLSNGIFLKGMLWSLLSAILSLVNKKRDGKFKGFVQGVSADVCTAIPVVPTKQCR